MPGPSNDWLVIHCHPSRPILSPGVGMGESVERALEIEASCLKLEGYLLTLEAVGGATEQLILEAQKTFRALVEDFKESVVEA